jgi:sodium-dependent dicarboxylate transporter 2/3/5
MKMRQAGLLIGVSIALAIFVLADFDGNQAAVRMAVIAVLVATLWITEIVPLAAAALLPLVLFPLFGIASTKATAMQYMNSTVFLLLGGFIIALAMQRWNLHKRFALKILLATQGKPVTLMIGFMLATAALSMWISNTATTLVMLPIALAVVSRFQQQFSDGQSSRFSVGLLLSIAYSASVGGMLTLVGTAPNLVFARFYQTATGDSIGFLSWLLLSLPIGLVMLVLLAIILYIFFLRGLPYSPQVYQLLRQENQRLGNITTPERWVMGVFIITALLWVTRKGLTIGDWVLVGWSAFLPYGKMVDDGTVAIMMAVSLFFISAKTADGSKVRLLDQSVFNQLPWAVVLLFGGGFALASGFVESGLSVYLAQQLQGLQDMALPFIILSLTAGMSLLTELTSNTATAQLVMPVLSAVATAIRVEPVYLMLPATFAASCAFMFPVATPPNAIVFGTGKVAMKEMLKVGIILNFLAVLLISFFSFKLTSLVL